MTARWERRHQRAPTAGAWGNLGQNKGGTSRDPAQLGDAFRAEKPVLASSGRRVASRGGKLPLPKLDVRAEGEEALVQLSHFTDREMVNGGPKKGWAFPGVPIVDFRCASILSVPGTFVPRPSPRSRLSGEGGPKERRARWQGRAGLSGLFWLPLNPFSPQISRSRP